MFAGLWGRVSTSSLALCASEPEAGSLAQPRLYLVLCPNQPEKAHSSNRWKAGVHLARRTHRQRRYLCRWPLRRMPAAGPRIARWCTGPVAARRRSWSRRTWAGFLKRTEPREPIGSVMARLDPVPQLTLWHVHVWLGPRVFARR